MLTIEREVKIIDSFEVEEQILGYVSRLCDEGVTSLTVWDSVMREYLKDKYKDYLKICSVNKLCGLESSTKFIKFYGKKKSEGIIQVKMELTTKTVVDKENQKPEMKFNEKQQSLFEMFKFVMKEMSDEGLKFAYREWSGNLLVYNQDFEIESSPLEMDDESNCLDSEAEVPFIVDHTITTMLEDEYLYQIKSKK